MGATQTVTEDAMRAHSSDHKVNTTKPNRNAAAPEQRLPHERDESPEGTAQPRGVMRQAADDIEQGLLDTDLHNQGGLDQAATDRGVRPRGPARPQPDAGDGMRGQPASRPPK
jgi:hypothetical protein